MNNNQITTEMEKQRVYGIKGTEYAESSSLIVADLDTALDYIKEEITHLNPDEERDYTIQILMMTMEEIEALPEFDG